MARAQTTRSRTPQADDEAVDPALPQKKRARHRLIGAAALSLVAAVLVPLLLEPEPVRSPNDVAIAIPSRETPLPARAGSASSNGVTARAPESSTAPVRVPELAVAPGPVESTKVPAVTESPATSRAEPKSDVKSDAKPVAKADNKSDLKPEVRPDANAEAKSDTARSGSGSGSGDTKGQARPDAKAQAKTDAGKAKESKSAEAKGSEAKSADAKAADSKAADSKIADKAANSNNSQPDDIEKLVEATKNRKPAQTSGKYVLQVGAFTSEASAGTTADKVRAAGVRVYTERVSTERGERIRVRAGPFATREAADEARASLKAAGITAATLAP
jgi:DedD protein